MLTPEQVSDFQKTVLGYYAKQGRHNLPWRQTDTYGYIDPYRVLVSELMLQQTQVPRVIPKFLSFINQFPSFDELAAAPLAEVLKAWSGLGYNRRAKFLWQAAQLIVYEYGGRLPGTLTELVKLPGVGANTAGAVLAYAYNRPVVFIETNIRTVYIHHFFAGQEAVSDKEILDLVVLTLPDPGAGRAAGDVGFANALRDEKPATRASYYRTWYWALMDYGTHLKQTVGNLSALSRHYAKQSTFLGSRRQVRGQVLRLLAEGPCSLPLLKRRIADERLAAVLEALEAEGLISRSGGGFTLYGA